MEQKSNKAFPADKSGDIEIIKKILSEKESDTLAKNKLYKILYEASSVEDISMDTDLIDECVKTLDFMEGNEKHLSKEKMKALRQNIDQKYNDWQKAQRKSGSKKLFAQIVACFVLIQNQFKIQKGEDSKKIF